MNNELLLAWPNNNPFPIDRKQSSFIQLFRMVSYVVDWRRSKKGRPNEANVEWGTEGGRTMMVVGWTARYVEWNEVFGTGFCLANIGEKLV